MIPPFFLHWNVGIGVPVAATANATLLPMGAVLEAIGWAVITGTVSTAAAGVGGVTGVCTISTALLLVTEPLAFVATAKYVAASALLTEFKTNVEAVAPLSATPFFFHWIVGAGDPDTTTAKDTVAPAIAVCEPTGCDEIVGATPLGAIGSTTGALSTVNTARLLVADPAEFRATAVYVPALALVIAESDNVALVAPAIARPFFFH
jgi:hypothetical protein